MPFLSRLNPMVILGLVAILPNPILSAEGEVAPTLEETLAGLALRSLGPALTGGRIADIAISPADRSIWYLAVGSGGVWKTENRGTTWTPIFDDQASYSIGCVTVDPSSPDTVWVGTGENVSGRHVGWGDGVYKSLDGGRTWQQMGLGRSEHIGKIVVDPRDGNVVYVAAEGPLWSPGGDRGLYKTVDGGEFWELVLSIDEDTGVTDIAMDPRNPDVLYAASYQRRRHIWSLLAGGPGSGIHKSTDGGVTWRRLDGDTLDTGLPKEDMGKIGLAISPVNPDVVYATIEAGDDQKGFYRSLDRGESWERRNEYISNGTGPHYYQEIVASPHDVDRVYQMDVFLHVTSDGGKTFEVLGTGREKHSDNHALVIDPRDPEHLIAGTDASLYETFDHGTTWRQFPNLPISQFYKLALDNAEPFYNILGGAQDLGTLLGPSRTSTFEGVRNQDWYIPMGADGYACAFDPDDENIMYVQWQVGRLHRYDRRSEEALDIQPIPAPGDPAERWNWDAPIIVSPHSSSRLYFGSQRLWRSDDRGDSWTALSGDLTSNRNRYEMEMLGRVWSVDSLYDTGAMSKYATLTSITESSLVEGLLYVGTDDGLIQVSEDGGATWRRASTPPGVPELSFVNDLEASLHDPDTVFVVFDAHKTGVFRPLAFASADRGRTWSSISGDLPEATIVWALAEDHVDPNLLFAATEFGLSFTPDGGRRWISLGGGIPTIALRDLKLQRRENDVVAASFGRGFYVLDDYSALREVAKGAFNQEAALFPVRDAWWYVPLAPMQAKGMPSLGSTAFRAPNPPFGALFTYYLKTGAETREKVRREGEKKLRENYEDVPFPGWDRLHDEALEPEPRAMLIVRNASGGAVRIVEGPAEAGIHRISWDLRLPPPNPVDLEPVGFRPPWADDPQGPLAPPGRYTVELSLRIDGVIESHGEPQSFEVVPVPGAIPPGTDFEAIAAFQRLTSDLARRASGAVKELERTEDRLRHLRAALQETPAGSPDLHQRLGELEATRAALRIRLAGDAILGHWNESSAPSILSRVRQVAGGHWGTRQAPTATQRASLEVARQQFEILTAELGQLLKEDLPSFEADLEVAGAPWTPGRDLSSPKR